jgi:hypothetical protein
MLKKSQARMASAWERRNCDQVGPVRRGAGSMPLALRISHTVDAARLTPRPASSPWILRYPHPGFSLASRRTRALMCRRVAGRPVLPRLDLAAQRRRTMSRCQRRIVSGVTSSRSPRRRPFGITASRVASSARSAQSRCGRRGCRRCSTASWWRRIKISALRHAPSRWDSRSHVVTRVMRRKANRRHMTGDHHGRGVGRATLLVSRGCDSRHAQAGTYGPRRSNCSPRTSRRSPRLSPRRPLSQEDCSYVRSVYGRIDCARSGG